MHTSANVTELVSLWKEEGGVHAGERVVKDASDVIGRFDVSGLQREPYTLFFLLRAPLALSCSLVVSRGICMSLISIVCHVHTCSALSCSRRFSEWMRRISDNPGCLLSSTSRRLPLHRPRCRP